MKKKTHVGFKFLAILLVGFSSFLLCANSQPSSSNDVAVMLALKKTLKPSESLRWSDPDPCTWTHVGCSDDKRVTRIQLGHLNIEGTLPPSFQNPTPPSPPLVSPPAPTKSPKCPLSPTNTMAFSSRRHSPTGLRPLCPGFVSPFTV
ncbi:hypothetical protein ACFX2H_002567 [Malus domestica]